MKSTSHLIPSSGSSFDLPIMTTYGPVKKWRQGSCWVALTLIHRRNLSPNISYKVSGELQYSMSIHTSCPTRHLLPWALLCVFQPVIPSQGPVMSIHPFTPSLQPSNTYHEHQLCHSSLVFAVAQFMHVLRQRIQLGATESIYLMVNGVTPTTRYVTVQQRQYLVGVNHGGRGSLMQYLGRCGHCCTLRVSMPENSAQ